MLPECTEVLQVNFLVNLWLDLVCSFTGERLGNACCFCTMIMLKCPCQSLQLIINGTFDIGHGLGAQLDSITQSLRPV